MFRAIEENHFHLQPAPRGRNNLYVSALISTCAAVRCLSSPSAKHHSAKPAQTFLFFFILPSFCLVPLLNTIHHLSRTFTAGWRPESNRASFLMMLPTPGMTLWSRRTSHSILPLWLLSAAALREKLNLGEQTSRLSMARTLCSQSWASLRQEEEG